MQLTGNRLVRMAAMTAACAGLLAAALALPTSASSAAGRTVHGSPGAPGASAVAPVTAGSLYLALGDSVPFGFRESNTSPPPDFKSAGNLIGYPEDIRSSMGLVVSNPSCPGETTGSFLDVTARSNGCETTYTGAPGYRTTYPLHARYSGSQMAFAESFLEAHPGVRAVSLQIGANDGLVCEETTKDGCASEIPALQKSIEANVTKIMEGLRDTAGYTGQIVIVNYYSTDYANRLDNLSSEAVNDAVEEAAKPYDVTVADAYTAFERAAYHSARDTCAAGLLTQLSGKAKGTCGLHPSVAGQALLAQTIESAFVKQ